MISRFLNDSSMPFFVWHEKKLFRVDPEDVMIVSTVKNYTKIVLSDNSHYLVRSSLSNALKKLPPDVFIQVSRSEAVSVYYIGAIDKDEVIVEGKKPLSVTIGKQFYKPLLASLNIIE